jgi:hypothetical protein
MKYRRIVTLAGAVVFSTFCLVTSPRAQDANGNMMHERTTAEKVQPTNQMHNSMSDDATTSSSATAKMKDDGKMHTKKGHTMMNGETTAAGQGGMMEGGSTGETNH